MEAVFEIDDPLYEIILNLDVKNLINIYQSSKKLHEFLNEKYTLKLLSEKYELKPLNSFPELVVMYDLKYNPNIILLYAVESNDAAVAAESIRHGATNFKEAAAIAENKGYRLLKQLILGSEVTYKLKLARDAKN